MQLIHLPCRLQRSDAQLKGSKLGYHFHPTAAPGRWEFRPIPSRKAALIGRKIKKEGKFDWLRVGKTAPVSVTGPLSVPGVPEFRFPRPETSIKFYSARNFRIFSSVPTFRNESSSNCRVPQFKKTSGARRYREVRVCPNSEDRCLLPSDGVEIGSQGRLSLDGGPRAFILQPSE